MEPITITIMIGSAILAIAIALWGWIREIFSSFIIPKLREHISDNVADMVANIISYIDAPISSLRKQTRESLIAFKHHVLGIKQNFKKINKDRIEVKTKTWLLTPNNKAVEISSEAEINIDDLPPEIREEMIRRNAISSEIDIKKSFEEQIEQKLEIGLAN